MAYIYVIENTINNKKYVGKTNFSIQKRFKEHLRDSKKNRKEKRPLYNAINKYGEENFSIRVLEEVSVELSAEREKYWINFFDSFNNGYNATIGGDGKTYLDYNKILSLFDNTLLSQREIAHQCNCSIDSVKNIVSQYREDIDWNKGTGQIKVGGETWSAKTNEQIDIPKDSEVEVVDIDGVKAFVKPLKIASTK